MSVIDEVKYSKDDPDEYGVNVNVKKTSKESSRINDQERAELISKSVKVSEELFPPVFFSIDNAIKRLKINNENINFYIAPDAVANAQCRVTPFSVYVDIIIASRLIELLDKDELSFVIGHELAHYLYKHYLYPHPNLAFSELDNISLAQLENTQTPEWADPFNSGLFSPRLSEHSYVFFEGERPRAWIIGSVVCNEALLIETMWSDFKGSYDLVYALLYIQFIGIWGHEMTNWLIESCIFCFQQKNAGMTRLLERMNSFKLEVNKTIQLEKSIKFKEYGE